jgi:hypothetical protein
MGFIRKFVILLLLALWLPVTMHCDLEAAGVAALSHEQQHSSSCGAMCTCHGCAAVEDGAYRLSDNLLKVMPLSCCDCSNCLACLALIEIPEVEPVLVRGGEPEPEALQPSWHFVRRAAMSPRAPNARIA